MIDYVIDAPRFPAVRRGQLELTLVTPLPGLLRRMNNLPADLHQQAVAVVTSSGMPVSVGRLRVHPGTTKVPARVELVFQTENVACAITIEPTTLESVSAGPEGIRFRYRLPSSEVLWSSSYGPRREKSFEWGEPAPAKETETRVEAYPLPPKSRLTGYPAKG